VAQGLFGGALNSAPRHAVAGIRRPGCRGPSRRRGTSSSRRSA